MERNGPLQSSCQRLKFCMERGRLLDLLNRATADYASAVDDLSNKIRTLTPAQYVRQRVTVDQARADAEHCREVLLQHRQEHGC